MDSITVTLRNWKKFNGRSDVKKPSWFRLDASLIDDPEFFDFSAEEFKAWIYILSMCCRKNKGTIRLFFGHAESSSKISKKCLFSAVRKLEQLSILTIDTDGSDTRTIGSRTDLYATDRQTDKQDRQDKTNKHAEPPSAVRVFDFESVYEKYPRKLGKAKGIQALVKQIQSETDFASLQRAVENYATAMIGTEEKFIKHFSSFIGTEKSGYPWREWIDYKPRQSMNKAETQSSANLNALKTFLANKGIGT